MPSRRKAEGKVIVIYAGDKAPVANSNGGRLRRSQGVTFTVANKQYRLKSSSRCTVCNSPHRTEIESFLLDARPLEWIARYINAYGVMVGGPEEISSKAIGRHIDAGHIPLRQAVVQGIIRQRSEEIGRNVEDGVESVLDHIVLGKTMMATYFRALTNEETLPTGGDIVQVMKFLAQIEAEAGGSVDAEVYAQVLQVMIHTIEEVVGEEAYRAIMIRTQNNPIVRAASARRDQARMDALT